MDGKSRFALQIKHKLLSVWSRAACEVLRCSGLRNGTTQRFGTAAQEETASACADAAPSCFSLTAYSLFSFCVTSCTVNELCLVAFQQRSDVFIKYRRKKAANLFKTYCLCADVIGNRYLAVRDGDRKICFFKV